MTDPRPHDTDELPEEPGQFPEDLQELVSASLDGALTPAEEERLADLLAQDPELHAYRERLRRVKRLVARSAPLMAGVPGASDSQHALEALQARLANLPERTDPGLSWQVKAGIAACVAGLFLVSWQVVAFSRRVTDRSSAPPQQSELSGLPNQQPDVPTVQPDVPEDVDPPEVVDPPTPEDPQPPEPPVAPEDPPVEPPPVDPIPDVPELPEDPHDEGPVIADVPGDDPPPATDPNGGTRVRPDDKDPVPSRPPIDLASLKRLVAGIHDASTPLEQRPSLIRSLGDPRFDHPLAYQTLSAILGKQLDRKLPVGQVNGQLIGPPEWHAAARIACAKLDTALAVRVLLESLQASEAEGPAVEAALARMSSSESVVALADSLRGRATQAQVEAALRALAAIGDPTGYAAVLEIFDNDRVPGALVRQAALAVGALGDSSSLAPLTDGLEDKRLVVRAGSAGGLGRLGSRLPVCAEGSVKALAGAMRDKELAVCSAAAEALATVGEPGVPTLIACLDPKQEPRAAVRDVVREQLWLLSGGALADAGHAADWWRKLADAGTPLAQPTAVLVVDPSTSPLAFAAWGERVVFMLDTSGSMRGSKWARTQAEVERAIGAYAERRSSKERGWVNLLAFADAPRFVRPGFVNVTSRSARAGVLKLLGQLKPVQIAQTDLRKAMQALQTIPKVDTLVLFSDAGQQPADLERAFSYVRKTLEQRPLRIHTVWLTTGQGPLVVDRGAGHVDDPAGATFMRKLAQETGGLFVRER